MPRHRPARQWQIIVRACHRHAAKFTQFAILQIAGAAAVSAIPIGQGVQRDQAGAGGGCPPRSACCGVVFDGAGRDRACAVADQGFAAGKGGRACSALGDGYGGLGGEDIIVGISRSVSVWCGK